MRLDEYPRPNGDTGIGLHYFPDFDHFDRASIERWPAELKKLGVSWLTLLSPIARPIPAEFIRSLTARDIEPVIRIYCGPCKAVDQRALAELAAEYAAWDIHYVYVFNEPNVDAEWPEGLNPTRKLVEEFVELLLPCLHTLQAAGLTPTLPPLSPAGGMCDLKFLGKMLRLIAERDRPVLEHAALAIHNLASNRPLNWGRGGHKRWPDHQICEEPEGENQDHRDWRLYEWYDEIVRPIVGHSLPMIGVESGVLPQDRRDPSLPAVDGTEHAVKNVEIARQLVSGEAPDYMFAACFWLLGAPSDDEGLETHAWFKRDGSRMPVVNALQNLPKNPRQQVEAHALRAAGAAASAGPQAAELFTAAEIEHALRGLSFRTPKNGGGAAASEPAFPPREGGKNKPLYHYLLLPVFEWGISEWYWRLSFDYVRRFRPVCGFDPHEASRAQFVTILGDTRGVDKPTEFELAQSGCQVERIAGPDAEGTRLILEQMVRSGKRFRQWETL